MQFAGRYFIPASSQQIWDAIQNPDILMVCVPRCESITKTSDSQFIVKAVVKVGRLGIRFVGRLELGRRDMPIYCHMTGSGKGRLAGAVRGEAEIRLAPVQGGTLFSYVIKAAVGGRLGQMAERLLDSTARRIADDFFARFTEALETLRTGGDRELDAARPTAQPG